MPTVTTSASTRAHSCSLLYLRPAGASISTILCWSTNRAPSAPCPVPGPHSGRSAEHEPRQWAATPQSRARDRAARYRRQAGASGRNARTCGSGCRWRPARTSTRLRRSCALSRLRRLFLPGPLAGPCPPWTRRDSVCPWASRKCLGPCAPPQSPRRPPHRRGGKPRLRTTQPAPSAWLSSVVGGRTLFFFHLVTAVEAELCPAVNSHQEILSRHLRRKHQIVVDLLDRSEE